MTLTEKITRYFYIITIAFLTLTGFGQMPIFKRYRIADIPGLGWLAEFYITHAMHYIFGTLLVGLCFYVVADHILDGKKERKLTRSGYTKAFMVSGLVITGSFMVFKNLAGTPYSPMMISLLDLFHLALCMALLLYSLFTLITGKNWVRYPIRDIMERFNQK